MALAVAGHNSKHFGEEEPPPPRTLTKEERLRYAKEALLCAKLLATCAFMPKKEVVETKQGIRGRILRSILIEYLHVRGCPKKEIAKILDMDKDQPGDDIRNVVLWRGSSKTDALIHMAQGFLDSGLEVSASMDEMIARCVNTDPDEPEEDEPEPEKPKPPPPSKKEPYRPGVDPKPETIKRKREAAETQAKANYETRLAYLDKRIASSKRVICKPGVSEKDAKAAALELEADMKARQKLKRDYKAAQNASALPTLKA